jgi:predicted protein tyrosine phosphatase
MANWIEDWITEQVVTTGTRISPDNWCELAERTGITVVVNMRGEYQDVFISPPPVAYLWLPVEDHFDPTAEQLLLGAQFIDAAVKAGHRVLIHCKVGVGRSATMAAAYLIWTGLSVGEAVRQVEESAALLPLVVSQPVLDRFVAILTKSNKM